MRNNIYLEYNARDNDKKSIKERATIVKENEWSFEVTKMTGTSLSYHENSARNLVDFLERAYPLRIDRIVLDFVTGRDGINYLFNVKYIEMEHTVEKIGKRVNLQNLSPHYSENLQISRP